MRLLLFGDWEPNDPGGPAAVALLLARELVTAGHNVLVISGGKKSCIVRTRFEPGIEVAQVPTWRQPLLRSATRRFLRLAEAEGALFLSVFIPHHVLAARVLRIPYAVLPLGGYAGASIRARGRLRKRTWLAMAERRYLEQAVVVNVWSRNEQSDVERVCRPRRVIITPPGPPHEVTATTLRPLRNSRRLLYLGRFAVPQKGLDDLLSAFARAAGPDDRLTLAGSDHRGGLAELHRLIANLDLQDVVDVRGPAYGEEKAQLFADHDAFVHLSRWEGLPLAVVEAMAAQLPVVVTAATNVGDLVATYGAGWVVDGDPAAALRSILNASPHERRSRGSAALRLVLVELSWSRAAADIVAALLSSPAVGDRRTGHAAGRE